MSGRSVTITIGTTGSIRTESACTVGAGSNGVKLAGEDRSRDKMYEPKHSKKMVRVLTVIAYMFTVSLAAIMLSIYYVFLWSPRYANFLVPPTPLPMASTTAAAMVTTATTTTTATAVTPTSSFSALKDPVEKMSCSCPNEGKGSSVVADSAEDDMNLDNAQQQLEYQLQMDLADSGSSQRMQFRSQHDPGSSQHMGLALGDT